MNQFICSACVDDEHLRTLIEAHAHASDACDYCERSPASDLFVLVRACDEVIENFYEVTSLTQAVVHFDYAPEGQPVVEVLRDLTRSPEAVIDDVAILLAEGWRGETDDESKYGDDPWFERRQSIAHHHDFAWRAMETSLRIENRFFNSSARETLEKIFGGLREDRCDDDSAVVIEAGPNAHVSTLYRARIFRDLEDLEKALKHPERELGAPPPTLAQSGRMNAKGQPAFYGATSAEVCISEVRPPVGSIVAVAAFNLIRPLKLLDLTKLNKLSVPTELSLFHPRSRFVIGRRDFLRKLCAMLSSPVTPDRQDESYLVTQAICDFLASHADLQLDGIVFPSSQSNSSQGVGLNVALFGKASRTLYASSVAPTAEVSFWTDYDSDGPPHFDPQIRPKNVPSDHFSPGVFYGTPSVPVTLEVDYSSLKICRINSIAYGFSSSEIE